MRLIIVCAFALLGMNPVSAFEFNKMEEVQKLQIPDTKIIFSMRKQFDETMGFSDLRIDHEKKNLSFYKFEGAMKPASSAIEEGTLNFGDFLKLHHLNTKEKKYLIIFDEDDRPERKLRILYVDDKRSKLIFTQKNQQFYSFEDYNKDGLTDLLIEGMLPLPGAKTYQPWLVFTGQYDKKLGFKFTIDEKLSKKLNVENKFKWQGLPTLK